MGFLNVVNNNILQAKKECLIKYRTDNRIQNTYIDMLIIRYSGILPAALIGSINYKGINYSYNVTSLQALLDRMNSFYQIFVDFNLSISNQDVRFKKRDITYNNFTLDTTDSATLVQVPIYNIDSNNNYPVGLTIMDDENNKIIQLSKAIGQEGYSTFDISSILKNNINNELILRNSFSIINTFSCKKFKLIGSTISNSNALSSVDIYALKTNIEETELNDLFAGKAMIVNSEKRYISEDSNEKIFIFKALASTTMYLEITAYNYLRRSSEVYSQNIETYDDNVILEIPTNWKSIKDLFSIITEEEIAEYVVSVGSGNVIYSTINYIKKDFKDKREFIYLNKFAVWDNLILEGKNETILETKQDTAENKQQIIIINKNIYYKQNQNTGFIVSDNQREHIKEFFSSEKIYEVVNGELLEIIIDANNFVLKQIDATELNNVQFSYTYANFKTVI